MRARYPDQEGFVERDGVKLHYEVFGTGDQTIFFLPTWSIIHSRFWKAQVPYFARHFRVLTFDGRAVFGSAHWKVGAIDEYARGRPAAPAEIFFLALAEPQLCQSQKKSFAWKDCVPPKLPTIKLTA